MKKAKFILSIVLIFAFFSIAGKGEAKTGNGIQIKNALVTTVDPTTKLITATKGNVSYVIDASGATLRRKYDAKCSIFELMTGDHISVWGTMSGTNITARKAKDMSIQKWNASFTGTISAIDNLNTYIDSSGRSYQIFMLQSLHRGTQTVRVYASTRIKYKKSSLSFVDLAVGDKITAQGIWNSTSSIVYNTAWIKIKQLAIGD
jgi:hypothetical protein